MCLLLSICLLTSKCSPISAGLFCDAAVDDDVDSAAALSWRAALVPTAFDIIICQGEDNNNNNREGEKSTWGGADEEKGQDVLMISFM